VAGTGLGGCQGAGKSLNIFVVEGRGATPFIRV